MENLNVIIAVLAWLTVVILFVLFIKGGAILDNDEHIKFDENNS